MTHQGVAVIVYASDERGAASKASAILKGLTSGSTSYYYYSLASFEGLPHTPVLAATPEGRKVIERFWSLQTRDFKGHLSHVRRGLKRYDAEDFLRDEDGPSKRRASAEDPEMVLYHMAKAGEDQGSAVRLYDNDGAGIRDRGHLKNVLDKWQSSLYGNPESSLSGRNPYEGLETWVVTADVHY